jgi:hypothetical protein
MAARIAATSAETRIGLTLLSSFYATGASVARLRPRASAQRALLIRVS